MMRVEASFSLIESVLLALFNSIIMGLSQSGPKRVSRFCYFANACLKYENIGCFNAMPAASPLTSSPQPPPSWAAPSRCHRRHRLPEDLFPVAK